MGEEETVPTKLSFSDRPPTLFTSKQQAIDYLKTIGDTLQAPWKSDPNEPYGIRLIQPNISEETQRLKDIDRHPKALEFMVPPKESKAEDFDDYITADQIDSKEPKFMFAVVSENNEIVGWVQYYISQYADIIRKLLNIPQNTLEDPLILEISYAKLFAEWPPEVKGIQKRSNLLKETPKGVAVSGVKQTLIKIKQMEETLSGFLGKKPRKIIICALTDSKNVSSEQVLNKNGFTELKNQVPDESGLLNNVWTKEI